ncbi:MAG: DUF5103 domain-containing protein [Bacteroidia bacterium]
MNFRILTIIYICIQCVGSVRAQTVYSNFIHKNNIRSVQFKGLDDKQVYPVLQLGTNQKLALDFDDLDGELKDYQYTIVHCDYDWTESNLMQNEYIDGVFYEYIMDNETSFNSYVSYTHYHVEFPNSNLKPKISGNYVLKVYGNGDEEDLVLTLRFFVYQTSVSIRTQIQRPTYTRYYDSHQELDVWVSTGSLRPINVNEDFKILYMQNGRWDNAKYNLKPRWFNDGVLDYNYETENVFKAGNEFRFFDTRNVRFGGQQIKRVYQDSFGIYNAELYAEKDRSIENYLFYRDFNGYPVIDAEGADGNVEGDYIWVHVKALASTPIDGGVYLLGAFTNWQLNKRYKLTYNKKRLTYEGKFLLKQGYYNYLFANEKNGKPNTIDLEGSFYQTENDYQVFFYMYSVDLNCDLLMGYTKVNSVFGVISTVDDE